MVDGVREEVDACDHERFKVESFERNAVARFAQDRSRFPI
jgi:hypothetical protein